MAGPAHPQGWAAWLAGLGALALLIVFVVKIVGVASPSWTTTAAGACLTAGQIRP
jgi:hypothetical protein